MLDQGVADGCYRKSGEIDDTQGKALSVGQATTINHREVGYARSAFLHLPQFHTSLFYTQSVNIHSKCLRTRLANKAETYTRMYILLLSFDHFQYLNLATTLKNIYVSFLFYRSVTNNSNIFCYQIFHNKCKCNVLNKCNQIDSLNRFMNIDLV